MTHELSPCNNHAGGSAPCSCHDCREQTFIPGESRTITVKRTSTSTHTCEVTSNQSYGIDLSTLVATKFLEANSVGILDLRSFQGPAHVFMEKGGLIRAGERVWWFITGMGVNGALVTFKLMDGDVMTVDDERDGLKRAIPRDKLLEFRHKALLTATLKVSTCHNSCDNELIVYPEQTCTLFKPYLKHTTFYDNTYGGWTVGSAASHPLDLSIVTLADGTTALQNITNGPNGIGPYLSKTFTDLEPGRPYQFSAEVKQAYLSNGQTPCYALNVDGVELARANILDDKAFITITGSFTATSSTHLLELASRVGVGPLGNDTDLKSLTVVGL
ncbi:hypothetical protein [Pseudomonas sp. B22129]|uniref:hypothetical protein n=1 Tax=Pseudomonas sp. B22129 TaxID=3235111 RepID=UPI00378428CC